MIPPLKQARKFCSLPLLRNRSAHGAREELHGMISTQTPLDAAREYLRRGFMPLPVPYKAKNPGFQGWQRFAVLEANLAEHFGRAKMNVGVLLGAPSGGLMDVDLDAPEALRLAPHLLPETGATFGRASNPRSHFLYIAPDVKQTRQFTDPLTEKSQDKQERKRAMLVEIRADGAQTIFPASTHETGEAIIWHEQGAPAQVSADELGRRVAQLAAAALLARYWRTGERNALSLALAGGLLRAGWTDTDAGDFVEAVAIAAEDEETQSRVRSVMETARKQSEGAPTTGWQRLIELTDAAIVKRVCEWLSVKRDARASAHAAQWNTPEELPPDLIAVPFFDVRLLPGALRAWIADVSERMQCPAEFPAVAAIVAAASLVGNQVAIRPKRQDSWTVTPNLWGACVGTPGMLKTPALMEALKPLQARERIARAEYDAAKRDFDFECDFAGAQQDELRKEMRKAKTKDDKEKLRARYQEAAAAEPVEHRYIVNDTTVEKLGELLNQNPRGLLLFRDELTGWLRSLEREGREQDRAFYLETWTGSGEYTYDRIGRGTLRINNLTLSLLGGIQPGALSTYLRAATEGGSGDDGLMQRFQMSVYPDAPRSWRNVDRTPDAEAARLAHTCFARLDTIDAGALEAHAGDERGAPTLRFDGAAQDFFDCWRADLERSLLAGAYEHAALQAHMAKYRSLMPSLALIFHLFDVVNNGMRPEHSVSMDAAQKAAAWCSFLEAHARRIYGLAAASDTTKARRILEHIKRGDLPAEFTERNIYLKGWTGLARTSDTTEPLRLLVETGWLRPYALQPDGGGRPTTYYIAHPSLAEATESAERRAA